MKQSVITGLFLLLSVLGFPQGEFNKWYFPDKAALDFNTLPPSPLLNNAMYLGFNATVSISDSLGNLLFYSNGLSIYNKNHQVMPNGSWLLFGMNYSQPVFAVKQIGNDHLYYLFGLQWELEVTPPVPPGLYYSVIDMDLIGGLGDVIPSMRNVPVSQAADANDKLHATRHQNNRDVWLVTKKNSTHQYASFLINPSGINLVPVLSQSMVNDTSYPRLGSMKISQDGKKLAAGYVKQVDNFTPYFVAEYCNFNSTTGIITPLFCFRPVMGNDTLHPSDVEFSPDSKLLYITGEKDFGANVSRGVFQYDATLDDSTLFMGSQVFLGYTNDSPGTYGLQLAPDGKIYGTRPGIDSLSVINYPNIKGNACDFQKNTLSLNGKLTQWGLPQFLQKYKAYIHHTKGCMTDSISFSADIWPPPDSIHWDFGDPASGSSNYSNLVSPSHLFSTSGNFTVEMWVRHIDKRTDTSWVVVNVPPAPNPVLGEDRTICTGDSVTFDAGFCAACSYLWKNLSTGLPVGTNQTFTTGIPGLYEVAITDTNDCTGRDTVQLSITPIPVVTNTPPFKTICTGDSTYIVLTSNASGANFYWTVSLTSGNVTGFIADSGFVINQVLVNHNPSPGMVTYHITPKVGSCIGTPLDYEVTVNPGDSVKISIVASANNVCAGTPVTFIASPINGGTNPAYQWKVNGVSDGTNSPVFTYTPISGDQVSCILNSSNTTCTANNPATSNSITMIVYPNLPVSVSVSPSVNPVCAGTPVTFTATPTNGGTAPQYQWQVNGANVGANSPVYTYIPANGDLVSCVLTSSEICTSNNPASSNPVFMSVANAPVVTFTRCFDSITTINAKPIKLKGGIPLGGTYSGPGVNSLTGVFNPLVAGIGTKTITYSYTNVALCSASNTKTIIVQSAPAFTCGNNLTDIRDNKVYPTVQIDLQCWMAADLNYGMEIAPSQHQRDNCTPEKYFNPGSSIEHPASVYQWDELMQYDDTPGLKGLCPPGWHVPTEAEWNTLFANWTNNAFAGAPLKYSGYSGFNALLSGVRHMNVQWDYQNFATFFWSSTPYGAYKAWAHGMNDYDPSVSLYPASRANAFSVRCTKD